MSKRKRARDECSICKANGTNAIGHLAQWCSYKDGPFEGNFKGAIKAKKESEKRAKKVKGLGGVASVDVYHLASDVRDLNEQMDEISKNIREEHAYNEEVESRNKEEIGNYSKNLRVWFEKQLQEQNKVIKQMQMQITQLQAQVTELKQPKQAWQRQNSYW